MAPDACCACLFPSVLRAALLRNTGPEQSVRSEVVYFMSTVSKVIRRAFLGIIYMSACAAGPELPGWPISSR